MYVHKMDEYFLNVETGEVSVLPLIQNDETGEYEDLPIKRFKIPSSYYCKKQTARSKRTNRKPLKADPLESQLINAAIFLLPTMIVFHPVLSIIVFVVEIIVHNWFHKTNKALKDRSVYFRSPLHGILKEMCGRCKEESATVQIAKLQDIQHDKLKNYLKRVVT
ncbi:unnamed protein product [Phyllotreta striolata]|uniref:Uncharacterized protein n=1 Tax=Phyllotreta striolata TaxID=444603 RepID=A0A9N9TVV2_PHYSR|nr:unnamed protein product [Phyllotreta striolata]